MKESIRTLRASIKITKCRVLYILTAGGVLCCELGLLGLGEMLFLARCGVYVWLLTCCLGVWLDTCLVSVSVLAGLVTRYRLNWIKSFWWKACLTQGVTWNACWADPLNDWCNACWAEIRARFQSSLDLDLCPVPFAPLWSLPPREDEEIVLMA